jgi:curved DNA-binding protein CbpA
MKSNNSQNSDDDLGDILDNIKKSVKEDKDKKRSEKPQNMDYHKAQEKMVQNEIASGHLDYYKIIGANPADSQTTINKLCNLKLAEYHPDKIGQKLEKYPPEDRQKQKTRYIRQYELVREAVKFLKDPQERKLYDSKKETGDTKTFVDHKQSFDNYIKLQDKDLTDETKQLKGLNFEQRSSEMNIKHGFDPNKVKIKLTESDMSRRLGDLELERNQQSVECMKKKLFDGNFDKMEFNRQFEIDKRKREKKRKSELSENRSIIRCDGIAAANGFGDGGLNYVSISEDGQGYEDLYSAPKALDNMFANKLGSDDDESISSLDDELLENIDVSYVTDHNKDKHKTEKTYEEYMRERDRDMMQFDSRQMHDGSWGSIASNNFNISAQMGQLIGTDMLDVRTIGNNDNKSKQDRAELMEAYKALRYKESER